MKEIFVACYCHSSDDPRSSPSP